MQNSNQHRIVSDDADLLILVNPADEPIGTLEKAACHDGAGILHRAFSLFVLNSAGQLLLQQRHASKRLWPAYWANSCCSHPRAGETMSQAVQRRAEEELGLRVEPRFLYKFEYQARYQDLGSEHELCWVYLAHSDAEPQVNLTEVQDWRWMTAEELDQDLAVSPDQYTPWLHLEWSRLQRDYAALLRPASR
jgi:isopentenyl-diphosphate Delta-isomerase